MLLNLDSVNVYGKDCLEILSRVLCDGKIHFRSYRYSQFFFLLQVQFYC